MTSFYALTKTTQGISKMNHVGPKDRYLSYLPIAHGMERWLGEVSLAFFQVHSYSAVKEAKFFFWSSSTIAVHDHVLRS
jgi:long-subunit acyl-CoA synthetase (AMP-forming)